MSKPETHDNKRREFLRGSALLGASASIIASTSASAAISTDDQPATEAAQPAKVKKGYQLSEHVKAYYRSAAS